MTNKKISNREKLAEFLEGSELSIGCYDKNIDKLSVTNFNKILSAVDSRYDALDIDVSLNRKKYVVELFIVDNEVDLNLISKENYQAQYGDNT